MAVKGATHEFEFKSSWLLWFFKICENDIVHHVDIKVKIFKPSSL
jgi:hypothetical protein